MLVLGDMLGTCSGPAQDMPVTGDMLVTGPGPGPDAGAGAGACETIV